MTGMTGVFDTHVHIWDAARFDYPWLAEVPALDACYPISAIDRAGGQVTRMLFIEADRLPEQAVDEARWMRPRS